MRPDDTDDETVAGDEGRPKVDIPRSPTFPPPPEIKFQRPSLGRASPGRAFSKRRSDNPAGAFGDAQDPGAKDRGPEPSHIGTSLVIGITLPMSVVVGATIGQWIDHRYSTGPWGTVILSLLGIAAGVMNVARAIARMDRKSKK